MLNNSILIILLIFPLMAIFILFFLKNIKFIKNFSIFMSFTIFLISLPLWILFDKSTSNFQYLVKFEWINQFNMHFYLGIEN